MQKDAIKKENKSVALPTDKTRHDETFNVVQWFNDGNFEYVRRHVSVEEAVEAARHYTSSVAARLGITRDVMITDEMDQCVFLWTSKAGIIFPPRDIGPSSHGGK